jgi:hypothetical protein
LAQNPAIAGAVAGDQDGGRAGAGDDPTRALGERQAEHHGIGAWRIGQDHGGD